MGRVRNSDFDVMDNEKNEGVWIVQSSSRGREKDEGWIDSGCMSEWVSRRGRC